MIFSVKGHVEQIIARTKTQTRRKSPAYLVGKTYAVQPSRNEAGIKEGRILIREKWEERSTTRKGGVFFISKNNAMAEGGYSSEEFENLFNLMYPQWIVRFCYKFQFLTREQLKELKKGRGHQ